MRLGGLFARVAGNQLVRRATGSLGVNIVSRAIGLALSVVLARALGASAYGVYAFAFAILEVLKLPTSMGLPVMVTRMVAVYQERGEWGLLRGLVIRANQVVVLMSGLIMAISVAVSFYLSSPQADMRSTFWISLLLLPFLSVAAVRASSLRGLHYTVLAQLPELIVQPGVALAIVAGLWWFGGSVVSPQYAMIAQAIGAAISFVFGAYWLFQRMPEPTRDVPSRYESLTWARSAMPYLLTGGLYLLNGQTGIIVLGWLMPPSEVAIYRVATTGALLIGFGLLAANATLAPVFARLHAQEDHAGLQRIVALSALAVTLFSLPVAVVFIAFGKPLLGLVFGPEFEVAAPALAILSIGQVVNAIAGSVGLLLQMTGHVGDTAKGTAFSAVVNVVLNILLVPLWGVNGAAAATAIGLVLWNLLLCYFVVRRLKIMPSALACLPMLNRKGVV